MQKTSILSPLLLQKISKTPTLTFGARMNEHSFKHYFYSRCHKKINFFIQFVGIVDRERSETSKNTMRTGIAHETN